MQKYFGSQGPIDLTKRTYVKLLLIFGRFPSQQSSGGDGSQGPSGSHGGGADGGGLYNDEEDDLYS